MRTLGPELRLLAACCARGPRAQAWRDAERETRGEVDWKRVVELAEHHGAVAPLLEFLSAANEAPAGTVLELRSRHQANAQRALWLTQELGRILDCFTHHEIVAMPYKGPVLSELLYGTVTWRQFTDNDILIHVADLPRATEALKEVGYRPAHDLNGAQQRRYLRSGYELPFHAERAMNVLEVQWQMLPSFYAVPFEVEKLFEHAMRTPLGTRTITTLCHEDLLLVLCVHAAKHAWMRLSWLADVARLIESRAINWEHIEGEAGRMGVHRIVAVTLLLAQQVLGSELPQAAAVRFSADRETQRVVDEVVANMARDGDYSTESPAYFRLMLAARERNLDRMRFLSRLTFTPGMEEWKLVSLPEPLYPLYRVIRLGRLVSRLAR